MANLGRIDIAARYLSETPKAYYVQFANGECSWLPKSHASRYSFGRYVITTWLHERLPKQDAASPRSPVRTPDGFVEEPPPIVHVTEPYQHQREGVEKLLPMRGGALFMEQGTGKTKIAIDIALSRFRAGRIARVVFIGTLTSIDSICREWIKHGASEIPMTFYGHESISGSDRLQLQLQDSVDDRTMLISDESDLIKNPWAKRTRFELRAADKAPYRLVMTGTPVTQSPGDLFSQFVFVDPTHAIIGCNSYYRFENKYLVLSAEHPRRIIGYRHLDELTERLAPFTFQRTKAECLDLPEQIYTDRTVAMTDEQADAYQQAKEDILSEAEDPNHWSELDIFRLFGYLQQITSGFWNRRVLIEPEEGMRPTFEMQFTELVKPQDNPKIRCLASMLGTTDGPTIVWCKYHKEVDDLISALPGNLHRFDGAVLARARQGVIDEWKVDPKGVLIANPEVGGRSLTLNESHQSFYYSNSFKYSSRIQSESRSHRIGQTGAVTYCDIWTDSGIDRQIRNSHARKCGLVDTVRTHIRNKTLNDFLHTL